MEPHRPCFYSKIHRVGHAGLKRKVAEWQGPNLLTDLLWDRTSNSSTLFFFFGES